MPNSRSCSPEFAVRRWNDAATGFPTIGSRPIPDDSVPVRKELHGIGRLLRPQPPVFLASRFSISARLAARDIVAAVFGSFVRQATLAARSIMAAVFTLFFGSETLSARRI